MKRPALAILALMACLGAEARTYTVTAYCHCEICCGTAGMPTASGRKPVAGVTVAGPRNIPFGTWVKIQGLGRFQVTDRLANAYEGRFDVFMAGHRAAKHFGCKTLNVTILHR
jgi:peptidoglycan DL-endopeptidase CwlO